MKTTKKNTVVAVAVAVVVIGVCVPLVARYHATQQPSATPLSAAALYPYPIKTYPYGG